VVLSALFWLPMVRNITRPIAEVTAATEMIAEGRFETRVGTARGDEIGRVGQAVDHMADRLAGFVKGQKRFLGDISHELCSPIARIQAALANLEQRADDSQKKYVADLSEEVEHMSELVDELLMFSRAGMKPAEVKLQPVLLSEAVQRVIDREGAAATNLNIDIDDGLKVTADPKLLSRALGNLMRNAIRYAGQAGPIELRAGKKADLIRITIADQGPGISPEMLPHIFDPFSRPEEARSRDTGGAGLGLSIVKSCIEACGGTIDCRNRKPTGMQFTVTLQGA
jgi:two-component system sensor histidine kinase CpxA